MKANRQRLLMVHELKLSILSDEFGFFFLIMWHKVFVVWNRNKFSVVKSKFWNFLFFKVMIMLVFCGVFFCLFVGFCVLFVFLTSERYYSRRFSRHLFVLPFFSPCSLYTLIVSGPWDLWGWQWHFIFIEICTRGFLLLCYCMWTINSVNSFKLHLY